MNIDSFGHNHLSEFRLRIDLLIGYTGERYFLELYDLVRWVGGVKEFKKAIGELNLQAEEEYLPVDQCEEELYEETKRVWFDIWPKMTRDAKRYLDSISEKIVAFKFDDFGGYLNDSFIEERDFKAVDLFHKVRMVIEMFASTKYANYVENYVTKDRVLTGNIQEAFAEYARSNQDYDIRSVGSAWGSWRNLKWVHAKQSFPLAIQISKSTNQPIRKDDDIFSLRKLANYFYDYQFKLTRDHFVDVGKFQKRIWDKRFVVDGEELILGEYGRMKFDPSKKQDGGIGGEGTIAAKFLKEIVDAGLDGIKRKDVKSIKNPEISGHSGSINQRLSNEYISGNIKAFCEILPIGSKNNLTLYFCVYPPTLYKDK